jgi:hypothetical protein
MIDNYLWFAEDILSRSRLPQLVCVHVQAIKSKLYYKSNDCITHRFVFYILTLFEILLALPQYPNPITDYLSLILMTIKNLSLFLMTTNHRVYRVPGFLSSRLSSLPPHPHASIANPPPPLVPGGTHSLAGEGAGGANPDKETANLVLYVPVLYVFTPLTIRYPSFSIMTTIPCPFHYNC